MDITDLEAGSVVDGRIGPIGTYVGMRPAVSGHVQGFILVRLARLFGLVGSTRMVPLAWAHRVALGAQRVRLDATRAEVAGCPPLRSDAAIEADAAHALDGAGELSDAARLHSWVWRGVVHIGGHSSHPSAVRQALAMVSAVPGVLAVEDQSYDDDTLARAVVRALTDDPATRAAALLVSCRLGEITLAGNVVSERAKQQASALASSVPGVEHVHNAVVVQAPEAPEAPRAPEAPAPATQEVAA